MCFRCFKRFNIKNDHQMNVLRDVFHDQQMKCIQNFKKKIKCQHCSKNQHKCHRLSKKYVERVAKNLIAYRFVVVNFLN